MAETATAQHFNVTGVITAGGSLPNSEEIKLLLTHPNVTQLV